MLKIKTCIKNLFRSLKSWIYRHWLEIIQSRATIKTGLSFSHSHNPQTRMRASPAASSHPDCIVRQSSGTCGSPWPSYAAPCRRPQTLFRAALYHWPFTNVQIWMLITADCYDWCGVTLLLLNGDFNLNNVMSDVQFTLCVVLPFSELREIAFAFISL